ncbi:hypothetical protein [uncultured Roseibium sp.]|uniref:hypothetical protein n=1 Tax=uncultured Roseibium sp. TaxID=1936171 RepID=UPI00262A5247|nr:hypothetical protein [uncultured Roseibium sp.]
MSETIDMTPTWKSLLPAIIAAIEHGTPKGRRIALEELERMAYAADLAVELQKKLGENHLIAIDALKTVPESA